MEFEDTHQGLRNQFGVCRMHFHGQKPPQGVCATCLIDRLSRLCPDCARLPPCHCLGLPSSSSPRFEPVRPFSQLSDDDDDEDDPTETTFRRSLSSALSFLRRSSSRNPASVDRPSENEKVSRKWRSFWSFWTKRGKRKKDEEMLLRSGSVAIGCNLDGNGADGLGGGKKGRAWRLTGSIRAFRKTKRSARVALEESLFVADFDW